MDIYTTLEDKLWDIAFVAMREFPEVPIVFSFENEGEEPTESYIMINVLDMQQVGHSSTSSQLNQANKMDMRTVYNTLVQFSFYGSKAGQYSHSFMNMLNSPFVLEEMSRRNLAVQTKTRMRRNPQKRETEWVNAFSFDVRFNYIINTPLDVDWVESIYKEHHW